MRPLGWGGIGLERRPVPLVPLAVLLACGLLGFTFEHSRAAPPPDANGRVEIEEDRCDDWDAVRRELKSVSLYPRSLALLRECEAPAEPIIPLIGLGGSLALPKKPGSVQRSKSIFGDPELLFDQAVLWIDPRVKYSGVIEALGFLRGLQVTRISVGELKSE